MTSTVELCTNCGEPTGKWFANQVCNACDQILPVWIYILCYGKPVVIKQRDYLLADETRDYPIAHYVGITRRADPRTRIGEHGKGSHQAVVSIQRGMKADEKRIKFTELCPKCNGSLFYYAESPTFPDREEMT